MRKAENHRQACPREGTTDIREVPSARAARAGKAWTKKDVERLRALAKSHTASEIAYILGRTVWAIQTQARERGIRYVRKPQTSQGEQLCWSCHHATNPENVCPWVGLKKNGDIRWDPVPGWEVEEMIVGGGKTLWVKRCPLFREG